MPRARVIGLGLGLYLKLRLGLGLLGERTINTVDTHG